MVEFVKEYEKEFIKQLADANKKLSSYDTSLNQENLLSDIKHGVTQAENSLKNMEKEILNLQPQEATLYGPRVRRHQESLVLLKKSLKELDYKKTKTDLLGKKEDTRVRLLNSNEILQDSGEALDRINKVGKETEDIGYETMNGLKKQRITIQNINDKVNDVGTNLGKVNRTVTEMNSRRLWMKFIMYGMIFLLVAAICILLYVKLL
jgi:transcriptional regulator with AAA-type ATPase domain